MSDTDRIAQAEGGGEQASQPLLPWPLDANESQQVRTTVRMLVAQGRPLVNGVEVISPGACDHGCKVYARKHGAVVRYTLHHSQTYGCRLPVQSVRLSATTSLARIGGAR